MVANKKRTKKQYKKPKKILGMTKLQLVILAVLVSISLIVIVILAGLVSNVIKSSQPPTPLPSPTASPLSVYINLEVEQTDKNLVVIHGQTNLPHYTIIMVSVNGIHNSFSGQDKTIVRNGKFMTGAFGPHGGLSGGKYVAEALMPYPSVQPLDVQKVIGKKGERLTGDQVMRDESGALVISKIEFDVVVPTKIPPPTIVPTPTPIKIYLNGGDIGWIWTQKDYSAILKNAYRIDTINGYKPEGPRGFNGGYEGGYTQFLVIELEVERLTPGYSVFDDMFYLYAYEDDNYIEYEAQRSYSYFKNSIRVYYQEKAKMTVVFEVKPDSQNFILCYQDLIEMNSSGYMVRECDGRYNSFRFTFGD